MSLSQSIPPPAPPSPFRHTFLVTLSNESEFYLPTRIAFAEGGYEVET